MHQKERDLLLTVYSLVVGLGGLVALLWLGQVEWAAASLPLFLFFVLLSVVIKRLGFHVAADVTHSLGSTVDVAALLILGISLGGWAAALSGLIFTLMSTWQRRPFSRRTLLEIPLFNAGLKGLTALVCGSWYQALGGSFVPTDLSSSLLLHALILFAAWVTLDHLGWSIIELLRAGRVGLITWLRTVMLASILVELAPLPISLLIAVIYGGLGGMAFFLSTLVLAALAAVVGRLAETTFTLHERVQELTALNQMGQAILQSRLDVDQLCELIYQQASAIVDTSTFHLGLFDGDDYAMKVWVRQGQRQPARTFPLGAHQGIVGWMRQSKQPLVIKDLQKEMDSLPAKPQFINLEPARSAIFVPLLTADQVLGAITIQSYQPAAFTENHLRLLTNIANQAAAALENVQLYQALQEEAWHLNALLQVAENIVTVTDLPEVLSTIVRLTPLLVGVERCAILLYDKAQDAFLPAQVYGLERELLDDFHRLRFPRNDDGPFAALVQQRLPVKVGQADTHLPPSFGMSSFLLLPLVARGEVIGAICVDHGNLPRSFSSHQEAMLTGIANQAAAAIENAMLQRQADEKERLEHELSLARQIQSSLLPACCPSIPGYELAADWRSARQVSGDFYDFFPLPNGKWGILIADVSDKGVPAALFMALSRSLVRSGVMGDDPPAVGLKRANNWILKDSNSGLFVTLFYAVLDLTGHQITYVNCGHNPPLLIRGKDGESLWIKDHGMALGIQEGIDLEERTLTLERHDTLIMYTDGVTEATNEAQDFFGTERLLQALKGAEGQPAGQSVANVADAVTAFAGGAPQSDDITLVALRRTR